MRILYVLANVSFPPSEGAHEQTLRVIRGIADRGHECGVLAFVAPDGEFDVTAFAAYAPNVELFGLVPSNGSYTSILLRNIIANLSQYIGLRHSIGSVLFVNSADREFHRLLGETSGTFDVIHAEGIPLAPIVRESSAVPVVFSTVDAWSMRQKRLFFAAGRIKERLLRLGSYAIAVFAERFYLKRFKYVHVVSAIDADYLRRKTRLDSIISIPVSLPMDVQQSSDRSEAVRAQEIVISGDIRVPYVMDGICDFLESAAPRISLEFAGSIVRVLSRAPAFGRLQAVAGRWPEMIRVEAWVPDFVSTLAGANVIVLPDSSGSGLKNRTVVAMASGRPVVGSRWAFEGVGMRNWRDGIVCATAVELVDATLACLRRPSVGNKLGRRGARYASAHFGLDSVLTRWEHVYVDAAAGQV